ncbi:carboxymuconolactone decarboxylase family protein [Streptomyces mobaraensis]
MSGGPFAGGPAGLPDLSGSGGPSAGGAPAGPGPAGQGVRGGGPSPAGAGAPAGSSPAGSSSGAPAGSFAAAPAAPPGVVSGDAPTALLPPIVLEDGPVPSAAFAEGPPEGWPPPRAADAPQGVFGPPPANGVPDSAPDPAPFGTAPGPFGPVDGRRPTAPGAAHGPEAMLRNGTLRADVFGPPAGPPVDSPYAAPAPTSVPGCSAEGPADAAPQGTPTAYGPPAEAAAPGASGFGPFPGPSPAPATDGRTERFGPSSLPGFGHGVTGPTAPASQAGAPGAEVPYGTVGFGSPAGGLTSLEEGAPSTARPAAGPSAGTGATGADAAASQTERPGQDGPARVDVPTTDMSALSTPTSASHREAAEKGIGEAVAGSARVDVPTTDMSALSAPSSTRRPGARTGGNHRTMTAETGDAARVGSAGETGVDVSAADPSPAGERTPTRRHDGVGAGADKATAPGSGRVDVPTTDMSVLPAPGSAAAVGDAPGAGGSASDAARVDVPTTDMSALAAPGSAAVVDGAPGAGGSASGAAGVDVPGADMSAFAAPRSVAAAGDGPGGAGGAGGSGLHAGRVDASAPSVFGSAAAGDAPGAGGSASGVARAGGPGAEVSMGSVSGAPVRSGDGAADSGREAADVPTTDMSAVSAPSSAGRSGGRASAAEPARTAPQTAPETSQSDTGTGRPSARRTSGRTGIGVGVGRQAAFGARGQREGADAPAAATASAAPAAPAVAAEERPVGMDTGTHPGTSTHAGTGTHHPSTDTPTGLGVDPGVSPDTPTPTPTTTPSEVARREDVRPAGSGTLPVAAPGADAAAAADARAPRARHRAGDAYSADALTVVEPGAGADAGGAGASAGALDVRRRALGEAHGEAHGQAAGADPFTREFEDFAARVTWDESWSRPGLDPRTRALLTLTALTTGGHFQELPGHARAALRLGVTPGEIQEALRHTALYAGLPAARAALAAIRPVMGDGQGRPEPSPEDSAPGRPDAHP